MRRSVFVFLGSVFLMFIGAAYLGKEFLPRDSSNEQELMVSSVDIVTFTLPENRIMEFRGKTCYWIGHNDHIDGIIEHLSKNGLHLTKAQLRKNNKGMNLERLIRGDCLSLKP